MNFIKNNPKSIVFIVILVITFIIFLSYSINKANQIPEPQVKASETTFQSSVVSYPQSLNPRLAEQSNPNKSLLFNPYKVFDSIESFQQTASGLMTFDAAPLPKTTYSIKYVLGQPNIKSTMMNRVVSYRGFHVGGIHIDKKDRIYVLDSGNNRILGFREYKEPYTRAKDQPADIVFGQVSRQDNALTNGDNTRKLPPTANSLAIQPFPYTISVQESPRSMHMATDAQDNLYIVDFNNNRILQYKDPFNTDQTADDVWGQPDFTTSQSHCGQSNFQPTASTLCTEFASSLGPGDNFSGVMVFSAGVDIDPEGNLWVTDTGNNRVLRFPKQVDGSIAKTANLVLGQSDFTRNTSPPEWNKTLRQMQKPNAVRVIRRTNNVTEVYVLEGEWPGQNRILVFTSTPTKPLTNGMSASRAIGTAKFQDNEPADKTNWVFFSGKWIHVTSGLHWSRGFTFDPSGKGDIWVNDGGNQRVLLFNRSGGIIDLIGKPNVNSSGCLGLPGQGYQQVDGTISSLCQNDGEIGVDSKKNLYISQAYYHRDVSRFSLPLKRNSNGYVISNGWLLHSGMGSMWNKYTGKTFENSYGSSVSPSTNPPQLFVSDGQRILVWNNYQTLTNFKEADHVVGFDTKEENLNNGGLFQGYYLGPQTVGGGYLWVSADSKIFAFKLPITNSGKNYPSAKTLTGADIIWADNKSAIGNINVNGMVYDPKNKVLWISDYIKNRVMRVNDPMGTATVDLVIGQKNKTNTGDNASGSSITEYGIGNPWSLNIDKLGNLYVVDSGYEGWQAGTNNRVLRFKAADINPTKYGGNIFPLPKATGIYAKEGFTTRTGTPNAHLPQVPTYVTFDSQNRMLLLTDSYSNQQNERAFLYDSTHANQERPQPKQVLPIPFGQTAFAYFDQSDYNLIIQDHTWSRILSVSLPTPTPTFKLSPTPTRKPAPTRKPIPTFRPEPTEVVIPTSKPVLCDGVTCDPGFVCYYGRVCYKPCSGRIGENCPAGYDCRYNACVKRTSQ